MLAAACMQCTLNLQCILVLRPAGAAGLADLRLRSQHCLELPWGGLQLP